MRSLLFAPANHARRAARLGDFGADAAVLDLEDAVADAEKVAARSVVSAALAALSGPRRCVRINALTTGLAYGDLDAVVGEHLDAVIVPKVDGPEQLALVDAELSRLEGERGLAPIEVLPLVETALGFVRVDEIALRAPGRVRRLVFGLGDFSTELGLTVSPDGRELQYARSRIVTASHAARLDPPLDGPYLDIHDNDGLHADTVASRANGFRGRVVVYPGQVEPVHRGYSQVPEAELAKARRIVEEFATAEAGGIASIQVAGVFVDYPIYRRSIELIERHEAYERG